MKLYYSRFSLGEIAEKIGKDKSTACKVMSGAIRTSVGAALMLSELLDTDPLFFLAPCWYDKDGTLLPEEHKGALRAWKYGSRAVSAKNKELLNK